MKIIAALMACAVLTSCVSAQEPRWRSAPPRHFILGDMPSEGGRTDPHPVWVRVPWYDAVDKIFVQINSETSYDPSLQQDSDTKGVWRKRAAQAYDEWFKDYQNPEKLYKVARLLLATTFLDTFFQDTADYRRMRGNVNFGFSLLLPEHIPPSYHFVRVAYIFNAGDGHLHYMKDLARRLLKRDPADRGVLIAMVREYHERGKDPAFEKMLFDGLFALAKTPKWKYWDDVWIARAMRMSGIYNKSKSYFDKGIAYLDRAIAKTPKGKDPKRLVEERAMYLRERDLPNFGRPIFNRPPKKRKGGQ